MRKWNRTVEVVQVNATVPAEGSGCEVPDHSGQGQCVSESADGQVGEGYAPFITDGFISFVGCSEKKPVRILRDTGFLFNPARENVYLFGAWGCKPCLYPCIRLC